LFFNAFDLFKFIFDWDDWYQYCQGLNNYFKCRIGTFCSHFVVGIRKKSLFASNTIDTRRKKVVYICQSNKLNTPTLPLKSFKFACCLLVHNFHLVEGNKTQHSVGSVFDCWLFFCGNKTSTLEQPTKLLQCRYIRWSKVGY
jgi:hypothetical protein